MRDMAEIVTYGMSELPPEVQQQIAAEQQRQGGASDGRQPKRNGVPPVVPARPHAVDQMHDGVPPLVIPPAEPEEARSAVKPKRNALKAREKAAVPPEEELVSMNVRLSRGAYDAVADLAGEYGVSKAAVIRAALSGNMGDFLGSVRFQDAAQGAEIRDGIARLCAASADIGRQLQRIGKNYNDALRLAHTAAKQGGQARTPEMDPDLINHEIDRFEAAAERLGEAIWRIQK